MPRKRNPENRGLPARWQFTHGAYYYQVPPGLEGRWDGKKKFRLGGTLPEAYKTWALHLEYERNAETVGELLERYALEVVPTKSPKQQLDENRYAGQLRTVFGELLLADIRPQLIYQFLDKSSRKVAARRAIALLSHAFTKAVEWGYIDRHPFIGQMRLTASPPRDRYVEDWEIVECLSLQPHGSGGSSGIPMIQTYIRIKLLTGISKGDLLRLRPSLDFKDDGIHVQRRKVKNSTGKRTIYAWTPELKEEVTHALALRPKKVDWLFCTRKGTSYYNEEKDDCSSWDSIWQRFMARVLTETRVKQAFTDHDLRAKCASDAETLEQARALLAHADSRTTKRIYRRRPEIVQPLKGRFA
ncbi:integrase [Herbaspirillum sp. RU 5E]|uniref:integrase n=1 Tax=Herbaspirillum sp. C7C2 TaxID=2736666 RepID=UPI001F520912|nr:integrase [Herbaspirillum sp. C7C2]MBW9335594.1 integrase [Herbaspirillum sp. RU 5E]